MDICRIYRENREFNKIYPREMLKGTREIFEYFICDNCNCLQIKDIPDDLYKYYGSDYNKRDYSLCDKKCS